MLSIQWMFALAFTAWACLFTTATATPEAERACRWISGFLPEYVDFPNSTQYEVSRNSYFTQQQRALHPACYVRPENAIEVAGIMKTLTATNATFNVKSGGFSRFAGASSIDGGVLVDLARMNKVQFLPTGGTMMAGPAAKFYGIYRRFDDKKMAGIGPKNGDLSVAGYFLGCGFSFYPQHSGFACDDVWNYEVVTAKGEIIRASSEENQELFFALRGGGGSSFGIVTRFDFVRFFNIKTWWQHLMFPVSMNLELMKAYANAAKKVLGKDLYSHTFLMTFFSEDHQEYVTEVHLVHSGKDTSHDRNAPRLAKPFKSLTGALQNITEANGVANLTQTFIEPAGLRRSAWSTSFGFDKPEFLADILSRWQAMDEKLKSLPGQKNFRSEIELQPVSKRMIWNARHKGDNALGLPIAMVPMTYVLLSVQWDNPAFDDIVEAESKRFIDGIEETGRQNAQLRGVIHMNYAHPSQDYWARLNPKSYDRLRIAARNWDPDSVLNRLWRGYFKFDHEVGG
ncbi:hypothetical protein MKX08_007306 [Trichoderma sp. CBMAI-0020]|nr:hypothetical protein MKX08_007306 [Trichoderma sp. CBMAI-0020]